MKRMILLLLMLISFNNFFSQISIEYEDWNSAAFLGRIHNGYTTTPLGEQISVNIGTASDAPQVWDFSNYTYEHMTIDEIVDPSTTPFFSQVPTSNYCSQGYYLDSPNDFFYEYYESTPDNVFLLAMTGIMGPESITFYTPPVPQMMFPVTYGTSWDYTSDETPNPIMPTITTVTKYIYTVDAFGTLKLPEGEFAALRLKVDVISETHTPFGNQVGGSIMYNFITEDGTVGAAISIDSSQAGLETVMCYGIGYSVTEGATAVEQNKELPNTFSLLQNYPNPFNPTTTIRFSIKEATHTSLKVFDILGNEVQMLVNEIKAPGIYEVEFDAANLNSGTYFYRLETENYSSIKKFLLLK
ncbi:MAG: T9SS C-terminal target domain-containing protein [Ignavibacteriales bacterium]|nr:MAG: T9SS C-terminal target domain-containing protein [Ignavibacteriales bacterium]